MLQWARYGYTATNWRRRWETPESSRKKKWEWPITIPSRIKIRKYCLDDVRIWVYKKKCFILETSRFSVMYRRSLEVAEFARRNTDEESVLRYMRPVSFQLAVFRERTLHRFNSLITRASDLAVMPSTCKKLKFISWRIQVLVVQL